MGFATFVTFVISAHCLLRIGFEIFVYVSFLFHFAKGLGACFMSTYGGICQETRTLRFSPSFNNYITLTVLQIYNIQSNTVSRCQPTIHPKWTPPQGDKFIQSSLRGIVILSIETCHVQIQQSSPCASVMFPCVKLPEITKGSYRPLYQPFKVCLNQLFLSSALPRKGRGRGKEGDFSLKSILGLE
eukprot:TRINITY_DN14958_c3_g1_i1.p1 TRINITY_DN14958_c3_g1~~TRINITY_DN14958_c3_g1_i1.p1  ORF type:complete len:186 (+),score=-3.86 TRINITY_DN14958_c3_g1_i1:217-774(+)